MIKLKKILNETDDYKGEHEAPSNDGSSAPAYDLTKIYPADVYSSKGALYYGHYGQNHKLDVETMSILDSLKGNPKAKVKIFRAVPSDLTIKDKKQNYEKEKKYILKHGKLPNWVDTNMNKSEYYDYISDELEKLENKSDNIDLKINKGDWVTINKNYAIEHGRSNLNGRYKILSKTVVAKDIYTNGDSIHEWGYDPS